MRARALGKGDVRDDGSPPLRRDEKILRLSAHSRASESHVEDNRIPELVVDRVPSVCRSVVAEAEAVFVHVPSRASHGEGQWQSEASCRRCSVDFVCRAEMIVWECREHLAGEAVRIVERESAGIGSVETDAVRLFTWRARGRESTRDPPPAPPAGARPARFGRL